MTITTIILLFVEGISLDRLFSRYRAVVTTFAREGVLTQPTPGKAEVIMIPSSQDPNATHRRQHALGQHCRRVFDELSTEERQHVRLTFPPLGPIQELPNVELYVRDLLACGYTQISRKRRMLARLPPFLTGREALATKDPELAERLPEAAAVDQYLRVYAPADLRVTVTPDVFAAFRAAEQSQYRFPRYPPEKGVLMTDFKQAFAALVPERDRSVLRSDDVYSEHPAWGSFRAHARMQDWHFRDDAAKFVPEAWRLFLVAWSAGRDSAQVAMRSALGMD